MTKNTDKRDHYRKNALIIADYTTPIGNFSGVLKDISAGGLFIRTVRLPVVGQPVILKFSLFSSDGNISVSGIVNRTESNGFAVKFDEPIKELSHKEEWFPKIFNESER